MLMLWLAILFTVTIVVVAAGWTASKIGEIEARIEFLQRKVNKENN